jgi:hypothetical protein
VHREFRGMAKEHFFGANNSLDYFLKVVYNNKE